MGGESPKPAGTPTGAVFLSYASQDAEAAQRICGALRAAGIEVWFDQSELRGGDAWDRQIRKQIHDCALFIPLISHHSQERLEGYFRLEWKLAVDRSHRMAAERSFVVPVVVDSTRERDALVPDSFRDLQWTHLPGGEASPPFVARVAALLSAPAPVATAVGASPGPVTSRQVDTRNRRAVWIPLGITGVAIAVAGGWFALDRSGLHRRADSGVGVPAHPAVTEKSIAVLPFLDMSEKHDQEYFSDGLTEELIDRLAHSPDLKVIARTSAFAFKGKHEDARTIAAKLGVANLLEGSVRKSANALRITAQLIRARDGAHLWSQSYDRRVANIFQVQEEIAAIVSSSLQAALSDKGTGASTAANPEAYNEFLRGKYFLERAAKDDMARSTAAFQEAIRLDPNYALAWVNLGRNFDRLGVGGQLPPKEAHSRALAAVRKALAIDPDLAAAHFELGALAWNYDFDFAQYRREVARALELDPHVERGNAAVVDELAAGRPAEAVIEAQRFTSRDPLSLFAQSNLVWTLYNDARFSDAEIAMRSVFDLSPLAEGNYATLAGILLARNQAAKALELLDHETSDMYKEVGKIDVLWALGRHDDSNAVLHVAEQRYGDKQAYSIAESYAFRGDADGAFRWLDRAYENREPSVTLIRGDWNFRKLRGDPRFKALIDKMKLDG